jgi:uncharacterized protein (TIGR02466 family)
MNHLTLQGMQPLFFSPLAVFDVPDHAVLNAALLPEIEIRRAQSPGLSRSNRNGWHSEDDLFQRSEPNTRTVCRHILDAVQLCTKTVSPGFDFNLYGAQAEGWINVHGRGGLNTPHDHPAWVWSGTYYVSVPSGDTDESGAIEFFDTRTNLRTLTVEGAACFASKFIFKPRAGSIVVFPSFLRHWVYPNESDQERISIAFNARFARVKPA